jgi:hypothetical protein
MTSAIEGLGLGRSNSGSPLYPEGALKALTAP